MLAGRDAEAHVATLLEARGWAVLVRNWRGGGGELDLVVHAPSDVGRGGAAPPQRPPPGGCIRFVEVKLRDLSDPLADESVTASKRSRLRAAARAWMEAHGPGDAEAAFLVALVGHDGTVAWIDDAFDG
jgi:putative endonuclease